MEGIITKPFDLVIVIAVVLFVVILLVIFIYKMIRTKKERIEVEEVRKKFGGKMDHFASNNMYTQNDDENKEV